VNLDEYFTFGIARPELYSGFRRYPPGAFRMLAGPMRMAAPRHEAIMPADLANREGGVS
jgi:hypothetical protein